MQNSRSLNLLLLVLFVCASTGCVLPRTTVVKNPGNRDNGIRYYRPKPYLLVKPMLATDGTPVPGYVSIETTTLPDFSEEYSIHVRTGLGNNDTQITLEDGWKLTGLNIKLDSQVDENLKAAAEVAKAIPTNSLAKNEMAIEATNVPLGLYEAVISEFNCKKQLYGFRYVGFMPYSSCPIEPCGNVESQPCLDDGIYGLVFDQEKKAMVFKKLNDLRDDKMKKREINETETLDDPNDDVDDADNGVSTFIRSVTQ